MVEKMSPACIIPCTEDALYWMWDQPGHIQELCLPRVAPALRPLLLDRALLLEEAAAWASTRAHRHAAQQPRPTAGAAVAAGLPLMVKASRSDRKHRGCGLCRTADEVDRSFERKFSAEGLSVSGPALLLRDRPTWLERLFMHGEAVHFYAGGEDHGLAAVDRVLLRRGVGGGTAPLRAAASWAETVCKNLEYTGVASV